MNLDGRPQQNVEGQAQAEREVAGLAVRANIPQPAPIPHAFNPVIPQKADRKCAICLVDGSARRLITCPEKHSVHPECFIEYVDITLGPGYYLQREHLDTTKCVHNGCEHKWNNEFIIAFPSVTVTTVQTMIAGRDSFGKGIIMSAIMNHCIRCPHCGTVFGGFDACNAVRCATCRRCFCAVCMEACPGDAHEHVMGHGGLFDYDLPAGFRLQNNTEIRTGVAIRLLNLLCDQRLRYDIYDALCASHADQLDMDRIRTEVDCEEPSESEYESYESDSGSNYSSRSEFGHRDILVDSSDEDEDEDEKDLCEEDLCEEMEGELVLDLQDLEIGDLESDSDSDDCTDMELSSLDELYLPNSIENVPDSNLNNDDVEEDVDEEDGMATDESDDVSDASSDGLEGWEEETVIAQITMEQERTDFCLDRDQFKHLCGYLCPAIGNTTHPSFTRCAVEALQTASEEFLTSILSSANDIAVAIDCRNRRRGRNRRRERAKVRAEDIRLAIQVARNVQVPHLFSKSHFTSP